MSTLGFEVEGAAADLSRYFFSPSPISTSGLTTTFIAGDPTPAPNGTAVPNAYVAYLGPGNSPSLELVARDSGGTVWGGNCGAKIGGEPVESVLNQGAVAESGSYVYFTTRPSQPATGNCSTANPLRILKRTETPLGPSITEPITDECVRTSPEPTCEPNTADDLFQAASQDGEDIYFTTTNQLTNTDRDSGTACYKSGTTFTSAGCDLYLWDASLPEGARLIQVSAGEANAHHPTVGSGAEVLGVVAISPDGSHAYFVAKGVLTERANQEGNVAQEGQPNLYVYERDAAHPSGYIAFIGTLSTACTVTTGDCISLWSYSSNHDAMAVPTGAPSGQAGDGHILVFGTEASLVNDDTDGGARDDYRYDANSGSLTLISKPASGGGTASSVAVHPARAARAGADWAQLGRWVSEDGNTITFESAEALTAGAEEGELRYYMWRNGQLFQLPGAHSTESGAAGLLSQAGEAVVSQDGDEVAFPTYARLVPQDGDSAQDVYVARVDGGVPPPPTPPSACQGSACQQGTPSPPLAEPSTAALRGSGNLTPSTACPKGKVRRGGKCVKKQQKRQHHKKQHHKKKHTAKHRSTGKRG